MKTKGELEITLGGRIFKIKQQFLDDVREAKTCAATRSLKRALILHSPVDEVVNIKHAQHIYESARHPKSFIALDTADHLLKDASDARYTGSIIATWADRYLKNPETDSTY